MRRRTHSGATRGTISTTELAAGALFEENPRARAQANKQRYLLVDEYQDTNRAQYRCCASWPACAAAFTRVGATTSDLLVAWRRLENLKLQQDSSEAEGHQARAEIPLVATHPDRGEQR